MILIILAAIAIFAGGYLVGSNNPLPSIKKKIADAALKAAGK